MFSDLINIRYFMFILITIMHIAAVVGEGISREEFIENVARDILKKIPEEYEIWKVRRYFQRMMSPTVVVLLQELERFNKLIAIIRRTLLQLQKALAGEIGMDSILDNVAYSLFNGQLPAVWRKLAPATCKKLGGWMEHFEMRQQQYFTWVIYLSQLRFTKIDLTLSFSLQQVNQQFYGCRVCIFQKPT